MNATSCFTALVLAAAALGVVPATASAQSAPKVIKKVPPEFPGEATRKNITDGVLKAKKVQFESED